MRAQAKNRAALALALTLSASWVNSARADEPAAGAAAGAAAVRLGHDALVLYEAGKWQQAFSRFEEAKNIMYSPVFLLYMARCRRNLNQLREAVVLLEELREREAPPDAPLAWANATRDAKAELEAVRRRVPTIWVLGKDIQKASVDGAPVKLGTQVALNPGDHVVAGTTHDGHFALQSVRLREGERDVIVRLSFTTPYPSSPQPALIPASPHVAEPVRADRGYRRATWLTAGIALASAVVGVAAGLEAKSQLADVRASCTGDICPAELQGQADRARLLANVSTIAWGIAGANAAFSLTFALLPSPPAPRPDRR